MLEEIFRQHLHQDLKQRVGSFGGAAGVALHDLSTGWTLGVNDGELFPAASTIKVHVLVALYDLAAQGRLNLDERLTVTARVPGSGVIAYLEDRVELTVRDLANLMILVSDNTATNLLMELVGFERLGAYLERWGLTETTIVRLMQDNEASAAGRENLISPREAVSFLGRLRSGDIVNPAVAESALRVMRKPKVTPFSHGLPKGVPLADKSGGMDRVRGDIGIIELARRPFAMAVLTSYGADGPQQQMEWVANTGRAIYDAMVVLDATSVYGQGIVVPGGGGAAEGALRDDRQR